MPAIEGGRGGLEVAAAMPPSIGDHLFPQASPATCVSECSSGRAGKGQNDPEITF